MEGVSGLRTLADVGVKIHKLKHIKLHAKLLFADRSRAIIGSINLALGSFDSRRELASPSSQVVAFPPRSGVRGLFRPELL